MKRRVCETCLYFEPAGFSRNGWCHHPARRQNSDIRLMVRANELGCRNGWNADLWVPATTDGATQREHPIDSIAGRARSEVAPSEQNDLITSIVAARTDNTPVAEHRPLAMPAPRVLAGEDIFVKQTPSLTWSNGPVSVQPATELVQDPKAAILRARDQFRKRRKEEGRLADRQLPSPAAPFIASAREAQMIDDFDLADPEPAAGSVDPRYENRPLLRQQPIGHSEDRRPVSPVSLDEMNRLFPSMTEFPEDRTRFESVPVFDSDGGNDSPFEFHQDDTWIETRQLDTVPPEPYEMDELFEEDEPGIYMESEPFEDVELSVHHRESVLDRFLRQRRERRRTHDLAAEPTPDALPARQPGYQQMGQPEDRPDDAPVALSHRSATAETSPIDAPEPVHAQAARHDAWDTGEQRSYRAAMRPRPEPEPRERHEPAFVVDDDFALPPPLPAYEPTHRDEQRARTRVQQRYELAPEARHTIRPERPLPPVADEFGDQPLFAAQPMPRDDDIAIDRPRTERPAAALPANRVERICRTCRDFRPAENGDRGWCTNKWAFSHRRMVDADDLACRNSLGSWWTPKDEVWRRDGDISRHAQETPRVDEWLFGSNANSNERRRSGS